MKINPKNAYLYSHKNHNRKKQVFFDSFVLRRKVEVNTIKYKLAKKVPYDFY